MFRTQYDRVQVHSHVGDSVYTRYSSSFDDRGRLVLTAVGTEPIRDYINSFADSCDINVILARFANGDVAALNRRQGLYCDVTGMPKTYAEMLNTIQNANEAFANLPLELRKKFNNDPNQFIAAMDRPDFNEIVGSVLFNGLNKEDNKKIDVVEKETVAE